MMTKTPDEGKVSDDRPLAKLRAALEREIELTGGFTGPVRAVQAWASAQLDVANSLEWMVRDGCRGR